IGLGDLLFFGVISGAFSPQHFINYFLGCCLVGIAFGIRQQVLQRNQVSIPFAGIAALYFLCHLGMEQWVGWSRYEWVVPLGG
ncbi:MAG: hypothetical protein AAFV80_20670, partial [Bacteroidota bacterium]